MAGPKAAHQLGTLGGGNHFLEVSAVLLLSACALAAACVPFSGLLLSFSLLLIVARMHTPGVGCAVDCLPLHLLQHMKDPAEGCALQVVYDDNDRVWVMLHSGSKNIGNVTATHYDRLAKAQLRKRRLASPGGLNFFHIESEKGQQYLQVLSNTFQPLRVQDLQCKCY